MRKSICFIVVSLFICGAAAAGQPGVMEMQSTRSDCEFDRAAFAAYYDQVAPWLGSGGPCTDADGDDFCLSVDCDDTDPAVNPDATEICDDGIDNNCDGTIDEGCGTCTDFDGDGYCAEVDDCDDTDFFVNPGVAEICGDGIDNDCFGGDEECPTCGAVGDPCSSNADFCSLHCHPRRLTCK